MPNLHPKIWGNAIAAYDHAMQLVWGEPLGDLMLGGRSGLPSSQVWEGVAKVSHALVCYFELAFYRTTTPANVLSAPVSQYERPEGPDSDPESFTAKVDEAWNDGDPTLPGLTDFAGKMHDLYEQIRRDYHAVQLVMVNGSLSRSNPGIGGSGATGTTRDPCRGFLTHRKELVVALRHGSGSPSKLNWGGTDWANGSGDMMHFDLVEVPALKPPPSPPDPSSPIPDEWKKKA
jgi:hypothetical protein